MYNPLLRITCTWILEKSFGGKSISDVLTAFRKSAFTLVRKNARKMKNCILLSEHTVFLSAGTLNYYYFFFAIMHPDAPGLLAVP